VNALAARLLVDALSAAFPTPAMSEATYDLYVQELGRLDDEHTAQEAITALVRSVRWLPTIAEVREAYAAKARALGWQRAQALGLPTTEAVRDPVPDEVVAWMRARGIDVGGLLRDVTDGTRR
jgi:hypothetical protein